MNLLYTSMLLMISKTASFIYLLLICCNTVCFAQRNNTDSIVVKIIESPAAHPTLRTQSSGPRAYLVKLKPGIKKEALINNSIPIQRIIDQELLIIQATLGDLPESMYEQIWPANYLWKLSEELLLRGNKVQKNFYTIRVSGKSVEQVISSLPQIELIHSKNNILTIFTTLESILDHIIFLDDVLYIGVESLKPHTESPVLDLNLYSNAVNRMHHSFPQLNGEAMTISIQEQQYNAEDMDFKGRHITSSLNSNEISNHATEMATIAAGAGNSFITGKGVAWGANITSSDFNDLLPDKDEDYASLNTWVQNHSYGTVIENFYGTRAESFDVSANRNRALVHVFSSGNEGNAASDRIKVKLSNGQEIISETVSGYFLTEMPFLVFPNPVSNADKLSVFSKEFINEDVVFRLYSMDGKIMLYTNLASDREYIPLSSLPAGLYIYSIQTSEGLYKDKLVIK